VKNLTMSETKLQPISRAFSQMVKVLVTTFAFNEGVKIQTTVERVLAATSYDVLVMDDGSTDGSIEALRKFPVQIVSNTRNEGIGSAMKKAFDYALGNGYDIIVIMAGNNKDDPTEIPRLLKPIVEDDYDFVQGSRFLAGGGYGNMPFYRRFATRLHPFLFSLAVGKWVTESTNGFRAFKTSILKDPRINWRQDWLEKYELEPYLLYKVITLGYKHTEVPVTKIYPPKSLGYTKMKAFTGWWSILRPVVYLALGIKK
jgi:dolichol-phosphate mannosyltransferase